jgi:hypothetical protein
MAATLAGVDTYLLAACNTERRPSRLFNLASKHVHEWIRTCSRLSRITPGKMERRARTQRTEHWCHMANSLQFGHSLKQNIDCYLAFSTTSISMGMFVGTSSRPS